LAGKGQRAGEEQRKWRKKKEAKEAREANEKRTMAIMMTTIIERAQSVGEKSGPIKIG